MSVHPEKELLLGSLPERPPELLLVTRDEEGGTFVIPEKPRNRRYLLPLLIFVTFLLVSAMAYYWLQPSRLVHAHRSMVASEHPLCTAVGLDILKEGGNAVDSSIASTMCLGVVNFCSSGIGGGAYILVRLPNGTVDFIDGREVAPSQSNFNVSAGRIVGVPGELRALQLVHRKYATLSWSRLLQPAIALARDGFHVSHYLGQVIQDEKDNILATPDLQEMLMRNGKLLKQGDFLQRKRLAETLSRIADDGVDVFYEGPLAEEMVNTVRDHGGVLQLDDLRTYQAVSKETFVASYTNHRNETFTLLAPSGATGGPSVIFMLNVMETFRATRTAAPSAVELHRFIEAMKFAFGQRFEMGEGEDAFIKNMVQKDTAVYYGSLINDSRTYSPEYYMRSHFKKTEEQGTMHLCVIDETQMAVSLTSTVNLRFGSGWVTPSGILLNNELLDFYIYEKEGPNTVQPNKRPLSSAAPIIVLKDNDVHLVVGGAGGTRIAPSVAQVLFWLLEYDIDIATAIQQPRVIHPLIPDVLIVEPKLSQQTLQSVLSKGHKVGLLAPPFSLSIVQGIKRYQHQLYQGSSDPRKGGLAQGFSVSLKKETRLT